METRNRLFPALSAAALIGLHGSSSKMRYGFEGKPGGGLRKVDVGFAKGSVRRHVKHHSCCEFVEELPCDRVFDRGSNLKPEVRAGIGRVWHYRGCRDDERFDGERYPRLPERSYHEQGR